MSQDIQYFEPSSGEGKKIINLIKSQGFDTCRKSISNIWLLDRIKTCFFGFISKSKKASIGKKYTGKNDDIYNVKAFTLCRIAKNNVWIDVICSKEDSKLGKDLMKVTESHIRQIPGIYSIRLYSLPITKLKIWYENLGFDVDTNLPIYDENCKKKAYLMEKILI